jgi:hypothetical protein
MILEKRSHHFGELSGWFTPRARKFSMQVFVNFGFLARRLSQNRNRMPKETTRTAALRATGLTHILQSPPAD